MNTRAPDDNPTLADFVGVWLRDHCAHRAAYIRRNRREVMRLYVLPTLGALRLQEIAPPHLAALQRDLLARVAQPTAKGAIAVFGEVWKTARRLGLVLGRPHADLAWPRTEGRRPPVFTADERDKILALCAQRRPEYLPLVACCFLAGLRPSEAAGLRWGDLRPERRQLNITRAIASREVTQCKAPASVRLIAVSPRLVHLLVQHRPRVAKPLTLMTLTPDARPVDSSRLSYMVFATAARGGRHPASATVGGAAHVHRARLDGRREQHGCCAVLRDVGGDDREVVSPMDRRRQGAAAAAAGIRRRCAAADRGHRCLARRR